jgi:hypothetical protein
MIEKIGNLAEKLATNVSTSRRGFLAQVGQTALGAAGVLGGLLALPGGIQAAGGLKKGHCQVVSGSTGSYSFNGVCVANGCQTGTDPYSCSGYVNRPGGTKCGMFVAKACSF